MEISEANKTKLNLFSTAEVAEVLKMNTQVVIRKLQSCEIAGYKLGKDWRVSEEQLVSYLESRSNLKHIHMSDESREAMIYIKNGRLTQIPASRKKRLAVLKHLVSHLKPNAIYTEPEVNQFLERYHSDVCTLRREMVINKLMVRKDGKYKVVTWNR